MQPKKHDEDFKKSIVTLYENGKTQSELSREYGVSALQKRLLQLEEENLILKKAIAIFTPPSNKG